MPVSKVAQRLNRKSRIRKRVIGNSERPRLTVFRSNQHIYAQVIDDVSGATLVSASSLEKDLRDECKSMKVEQPKVEEPKEEGKNKKKKKGKPKPVPTRNMLVAKKIGETIAERCKSNNIEKVVFDRNGYKYHGRIRSLADAARKAGLNF